MNMKCFEVYMKYKIELGIKNMEKRRENTLSRQISEGVLVHEQ